MHGGLETEHRPDPRQSPFLVARDICITEQAMKIKQTKNAAELEPARIIPRAKRIVLVVADGLGSRLLNDQDCFAREMNRLVEPDDIGFEAAYKAQEVTIDPIDKRADRQATGGGRQVSGSGIISSDVERNDFRAKPLQTSKTVAGGPAGKRSANAKNATRSNLVYSGHAVSL